MFCGCIGVNEHSACTVTKDSGSHISLENNVHKGPYFSLSLLFVCSIAKHNLCSGKTVFSVPLKTNSFLSYQEEGGGGRGGGRMRHKETGAHEEDRTEI